MSLVAKNPEFRELHNYYTTQKAKSIKEDAVTYGIAAKLLRVFMPLLTKAGYDPKKMVNDIRRPALYAGCKKTSDIVEAVIWAATE